MSGICGIVTVDARPVAAAELSAMVERLRTRGPDDDGMWVEEHAALGHTLLATTPEARVEKLPLTELGSKCTITADVRLDNRDELVAALGIGSGSRAVGDGELILHSYLRWGENCVDHLLGDFAFAIWDERRRRLFCARDQIGMRQLHYCHLPDRLFLFATEPEAILAHPAAPRALNEGRIADFLGNLESLDLDQTFFEGISRLPPAHVLIFDPDKLSCRRYWRPEPEAELRLGSDAEYAEAFLEVFNKAVHCRLRSAGPIGAMLSGGTDSTSVAAVAAKELAKRGAGPLFTFSGVGPDPNTCPETRAIGAALTIPGISPTVVDHANLSDYLDDLVHLTTTANQPFEGWMTIIRAMYLAASRRGINVVLDGVAADLTVGAGWVIANHFRKGRILQAARESLADADFWGPKWPAYATFLSGAWRAFSPIRLRELRHRLTRALKDPAAIGDSLIAEDFARDVNLAERRRRWRRQIREIDSIGPHQAAHWSVHPYLVVARERYDRIASAVAIEPRDPFSDLRVVKFGLRLPPEQRQRDGWPKFILRNATAGLLPDAVRWRRGKEHLGRSFTAQLFQRLAELRPSYPTESKTLSNYVDLKRAGEARRAAANTMDLEKWQEVVYLALWLDCVAGICGDSGAAR